MTTGIGRYVILLTLLYFYKPLDYIKTYLNKCIYIVYTEDNHLYNHYNRLDGTPGTYQKIVEERPGTKFLKQKQNITLVKTIIIT